jgi:hypothetical protein
MCGDGLVVLLSVDWMGSRFRWSAADDWPAVQAKGKTVGLGRDMGLVWGERQELCHLISQSVGFGLWCEMVPCTDAWRGSGCIPSDQESLYTCAW